MKRVFAAALLSCAALTAHALPPYQAADKVVATDLSAAIAAVRDKLTAAGYVVIGTHQPKGMTGSAAVVVTDPALTDALTAIGGSAVIGIPIRVGVKADGSVSVANLDYWERAYLRKDYPRAEAAIKAAKARLDKALGAGAGFGGDVAADDLATYRYMFGMERFDSLNSQMRDYANFDQAVQTVRDNLAKGVKGTRKVYELVYPERRIAVFGVGMADPEDGEGWWVNKIGADHVAALPWEIYIVDRRAYSLYGRYRTALGWPSLGMGQFMTIRRHPDTTMEMMQAVCGVEPESPLR